MSDLMGMLSAFKVMGEVNSHLKFFCPSSVRIVLNMNICFISSHQNDTAERSFRTLVEIARCLLLEYYLPKNIWPYAVMCAAHISNRCFNNINGTTPFHFFLKANNQIGLECKHLVVSVLL